MTTYWQRMRQELQLNVLFLIEVPARDTNQFRPCMVCVSRGAVNKVVSENPEKFKNHRVTTISADDELADIIYYYESRGPHGDV